MSLEQTPAVPSQSPAADFPVNSMPTLLDDVKLSSVIKITEEIFGCIPTGETRTVQLGSPRRLQVIFETNMQTSYAAGHWAQIQQNKADAPYLMYDAVHDGQTRPEHAAWDGTVLLADDPWWQTHYPPNDWGCRCGVIQLSGAQVAAMGKDGPDAAPPVEMRSVLNTRTGDTEQVPKGVGLGWDYAPGASRADLYREQLTAKQREFRDGK